MVANKHKNYVISPSINRSMFNGISASGHTNSLLQLLVHVI